MDFPNGHHLDRVQRSFNRHLNLICIAPRWVGSAESALYVRQLGEKLIAELLPVRLVISSRTEEPRLRAAGGVIGIQQIGGELSRIGGRVFSARNGCEFLLSLGQPVELKAAPPNAEQLPRALLALG